ncbi:PAS domain S-box protein [Ectobacillus ponti]|uniref:histidine kinase n=1 Tax=Ectobacillus ponti TaxID=2961894 RepID=A0AA41X9L1_9BACI|nr:PAS domain S-box protein [Ectobacillus ponti]MCP8969410.1 PAS domain S-box protein [Ectobacillus ponti]
MIIPQINALEILDRITDGFFALDRDWNFTYMNAEAGRLLFRDHADICGKNIWAEFPAASALPFYKQYHKAMSAQTAVTFDAYFPPLDAWFDVRAYPCENGLSVFFKDITDQRLASAQNEQHYRSLFEQNPDAVYSFDLQGNYLSVNPAMEKMFGYSEAELLQSSFTLLVAPEDLERTIHHYELAANGITQHYEVKARHKDGHVIHVRVTNIPIIVDGEIVGVYGIAKDVTIQKQTEDRLVRSEKLTAVGQLSASIAHEIRNPLTSLKGFLQLMRTSAEDSSTNYFHIMESEITRIEAITGELLLLAKPQAQQFRLESVQDIVEDVMLLLSSQALMNKVTLEADCEVLPPVQCIGNQLKQVFINLVKNSIEAMPEGGCIRITLQQYDAESICVQIQDEGCGIPAELLDKIGLPFYTTKEKGTGLGMLTTFKIVESHGGRMHIESKVGTGTKVSIYLPFQPPLSGA